MDNVYLDDKNRKILEEVIDTISKISKDLTYDFNDRPKDIHIPLGEVKRVVFEINIGGNTDVKNEKD